MRVLWGLLIGAATAFAQSPLTVVSAASYTAPVARGSLAVVFGTGLANDPHTAAALGGTTVQIIDSQNTRHRAELTGDPVAFARALAGRKLLFQIARGDQTVPNPASSNLIRAAGAIGSAVLYRHDIARSVSTGLAENPHAFLVDIRSIPAIAVALAAQGQIAGFFAADGSAIPDANSTTLELLFLGRRIFERPATLPEDPGF
ncbi:MAG TPA: hypothetical protein VFL57_08250 [Bryobacteraceae bacterium]|nr:hypothetical protein [Bryobacteraceae bacterium]